MNGWYLEKYDARGERVTADDGHSFGTVKTAAEEWKPGGLGAVRFIAPRTATQEQIDALKALGAMPT